MSAEKVRPTAWIVSTREGDHWVIDSAWLSYRGAQARVVALESEYPEWDVKLDSRLVHGEFRWWLPGVEADAEAAQSDGTPAEGDDRT